MNDKLNKWKLSQIQPKNARNGACPIEELITFTARANGKSSLRFSIHRRAIKTLGWIPGDKISMDYDNGNVVMYRSKDSGRVLSKQTSSTRMRIRFCLPEEFLALFDRKMASKIEIADGAIAFTLVDL